MIARLLGVLAALFIAACGGPSNTPADATIDVAVDAPSTAKDIAEFAFPVATNPALGVDVTATITDTTIAATIPYGTSPAALTATFSTTGVAVAIGGTTQVSGVTANDFTSSVVYRITAADNSTKDYTVTVTVALNPAKDLTSVEFLAANNSVLSTNAIATITGTSILATVPFGTDTSALKATFTTTGASVAVGATAQVTGVTVNDFRTPVIYRVTAEDGSTKDYVIQISVASTYVKASAVAANDLFGFKSALSADGNTLAVGAYGKTSSTGAVYVFVRSGSTWAQQAILAASNPDVGDRFGSSVAISADGNTLAVGAYVEASIGVGVNSATQADNTAAESGAVYVFTRSGTTWTQQAYVKASNTRAGARFGFTVALSSDSTTLAVGSPYETSNATGINGNQTDTSAGLSGAVYVFTRVSTTWTQQAYLKASNTNANDKFGTGLSLAGDGSTLAVAAVEEDSVATGIDGNQSDNTETNSGAVYVFTRVTTTWSQQAYVKASNTGAFDLFGGTVALSADSNTLAIGAIEEDSAAIGIGGVQTDNNRSGSGAVYVFTRSGTAWSQQAYVKPSNPEIADSLASDLSLTADGNMLAASTAREDGAARGVGGDQSGNAIDAAGAVYVFTRSGTTWSQRSYVKATNPGPQDRFGDSVGLSADGRMLAACARGESSAATGINGNQNDDTVANSGACYLYE